MNQENPAARPLLLRPRTSGLIDELLSKRAFLRQLTLACGSPLNILLPDQLAENVSEFQQVLSGHGLDGRIFFAHKSNQSASLIRQMSTLPVSVDVASLEELRHALSAGFDGTRIEATGPKSPEFLALCVQHGVTINVDSLQELTQIQAVLDAVGAASAARLLLRLCGFSAAHTQVLAKQSRFGIRFDERYAALNMVASDRRLRLLGFSFHLDSVSLDERIVALENCLAVFEESLELGLEPYVLNIGGGFRINYLQHEEDWNNYTTALKEAALGIGPALTWQGNHFGLSVEHGVLRGQLNSYAYFDQRPGAMFLDDLLDAELPAHGQRRVADVLRDNMIELWLEPGRAILDRCGLTLATVNTVKASSAGDTLVGLNMKRQDISFLDQEIFVDPLILSGRQRVGDFQTVFFAGNLCLESDLISRRQVYLRAVPKPGDLVVFINTAAYMMDFSSTRSIMQPVARKVAVVKDKRNFVWMLDEQYTPVWRLIR